MIPTGRQIREGRVLANLSQADLATAADVAVGLVTRAEAVDGLPMVKRVDSVAIQRALEAAGVEFIPENGGGAGGRAAERVSRRVALRARSSSSKILFSVPF